MEILERNEQALECLEKKFILKYQSLKDCDFEHCFVTETINHQKIICQERDGYNWRLNSIYEPELAAQKYAKGHSKFLLFFHISEFFFQIPSILLLL